MNYEKKIAASLLFLCLLFGTACGNSTGGGANDIRNEAAMSAAASALEENGMKKIGEPVQWTNPRGPVMEFTVQKVEIFDHYTDLGLPESEFVYGTSDLPFILVELKIKKISGPDWEDEDDNDNITNIQLYNKSMLEAAANGENFLSSEICYFSGHGETDENGKGYERYWLDPGEETVFQVGWCVHEPITGRGKPSPYLSDTEGLVLHIGSSSNYDGGKYIDLTTSS